MEDPKTSKDFAKNKYFEEQIKGFIKNYPEKLNVDFWCNISRYQTLSESFIIEFKAYVDWGCISYYQDLSESFIREFRDKVDWWRLSKYKGLSESSIREFKNYVYWELISAFQDLSEPFLIEFIKDIELGYESYWGLIDNEKIPEDVKKRIIDLKKVVDQ